MSNNTKDCIFCKVAKKEIPSKVVFENDDFFAFHDINPVSPTHVLVIPKKHYKNLFDVEDKEFLGRFLTTAKEVALKEGLKDGFRTVINTGDNGGQTVYHLHLHVLGGRFHRWPPG